MADKSIGSLVDIVLPQQESILNKGVLGIIRRFPMKIAEDRIDELYAQFDANNNQKLERVEAQ